MIHPIPITRYQRAKRTVEELSERPPPGWVALVILLCCLWGCRPPAAPLMPAPQPVTSLDHLIVLTQSNSHCYLADQGRPTGFEYELVKAFADAIGARLTIRPMNNPEEMVQALNQGQGHLIAANLPVTNPWADQLRFSQGYLQVTPQIISAQHDEVITSPWQLAGKTVHVPRGTAHQATLERLAAQGVPLTIVAWDQFSEEDLIAQVARGEIEATLVHSNVATLYSRHYPSVSAIDAIGDRVPLAWAVHPDATHLLRQINRFLDQAGEDGFLAALNRQYYVHPPGMEASDFKGFQKKLKSRLPRLEGMIQHAAHQVRLDWELLVSVIYQESMFDPNALGPRGSCGLMQIQPELLPPEQMNHIWDPAVNIRTGSAYLKWLYDGFEPAEDPDRLMITLAAYNAGKGHINDARMLARRLGKDPNRWSSLELTLPLLKLKKYYRQARHGYCRGDQVVAYVQQVITYYHTLKQRRLVAMR